MVVAREIFKGFCRYYNSLNILFKESVSTHTVRLLSFFDTLGRMLGYRIYSEYAMKTLGIPCPPDLKNKKIDMMWWHFEEEGEMKFELAAELQQTFNMKEYVKDIRKLVAVPAKLKVFYCASKDHKEIFQVVRNELEKQAKNNPLFLIMVDPWVGPSEFGKGTFRGLLLDHKGLVRGEGTAKVTDLIDGIHLRRMLIDVEWRSKT